MSDTADLALPDDGKLAHNIAHFARALRKAGLPIGPGRVIDAIAAVQAAGFTRQRDFYWTLHACFVSRPEHRAVFGQVFRLFWRDPRYLEHMMSLLFPAVRGTQAEHRPGAAETRAAEALLDGLVPQPPAPDERADSEEIEIDLDSAQTMSREERLRSLDFDQMTADEAAEARRMLARLTLPVRPLVTRRSAADLSGPRPDWRRTMARAMRQGGDITRFERRAPRHRWPNLVVLCDISGSMSQYSRAVLHFVHAVANARGQGWARVHAFTFGTRLTNITRHMARRDVDAALAAAGAEARDWSGGTRIGDALHAFNRDWGRRVLGQGAVVLLITDGLDRDDTGEGRLGREMERLHLSCRRLIWINPLLRWDGFAPRATGIRAMLPHVDSFRAGHTIAALAGLAEALADGRDTGEKARLMRLMAQGRGG
jgi:hypothetical protein